MKMIIGVLIACVVLIVGLKYLASQEEPTEGRDNDSETNKVLSTQGLHWHPTLKIFVRGEEVPVPANIGLLGGHNPMHTHDADGVIHLEFQSVVREDSLRLGKFFEIWRQPFSETQILEYTNSDTERVRMTVNGVENTEYENYMLQQEDVVEIRFE